MRSLQLSWATAGCDWHSPPECDALQCQRALKFAVFRGPPPNDPNRTWADTPTPQNSILFFPWEDAKASIVITYWNQGEFFAGIPCTDSSRCVCASVNMLQERCCVCCSHRVLNYSWLPHSKILPVSYFAGEKGQSNIYIATKPWTTPKTIFIKRLNMLW